MISLTVDGTSVEVEEGSTILDAARLVKAYIPTLCYQGDLEHFGACRLCLVEIEGFKKLIAACTTPATQGMVVKTKTPEIDGMRKTIVELLLLHHPLDCLACDRGGNCDLQDLAFDLKVTKDRFGYQDPGFKYSKADSIIIRDMSKCVLCGRCVRVCDEIRNIGAIGFFNRGIHSEIGYPCNRLINCEFCGQCLASCPVGALSSKMSMYEARPWQVETKESVCSYCGVGCSFKIEHKGDKVVKIASEEGKKGDANGGLLCTKGRFGYGYVNSPDRLKEPMIRKDGQLVAVEWHEAIDFVAEKFQSIKDESGSDSLAGLASSRCTNEENYLFQKFFREVLGTNNIDSYTRAEHASTIVAMEEMLGLNGAATNSLEKMGESDCIVVIGANPSNSHPIASLFIKRYARNNGAKVVVIDSQIMELSRFAEKQIRPALGSEISVLNYLTSALIAKKSNLPSLDGLSRLKSHLSKYSAEKVSSLSGVSVEDLGGVAEVLAAADKVSVVFGSEFVQSKSGTDNVRALINLALVLDVFDKEGAGFYPLRVANNSQGCSDMGALPDYFPGYRKVSSGSDDAFASVCKNQLPSSEGKNFPEMLDAMLAGNIKAFYVMGENPTHAFPGAAKIREAFNKLDFLVVQDIFPSELQAMADVVLPAASYSEKVGTFTSLERRVQKFELAVNPPGKSIEDWKIISRLASKMGTEYAYKKSEDIFNEIASVVAPYSGMTYDALGNHGLFWPRVDGDAKNPAGKCLQRAPKKRLALVEQPSLPESTANYPFLMLVGPILFQHVSGAMSGRADGLKFLAPEAVAELHPSDAKKNAIKDGDLIEVDSGRASVKLKCRHNTQVKEGSIFLPSSFEEVSVSSLFDVEVDPASGGLSFGVLPVKITKTVAEG